MSWRPPFDPNRPHYGGGRRYPPSYRPHQPQGVPIRGVPQSQSYGMWQQGWPQQGVAQGWPQQGVAQGWPQQGVAQGWPQQGVAQGWPQQGVAQGWPQQGVAQGWPQQGVAQGWPQQGYAQGWPQQGVSQGWPQQGVPRGRPQQGVTQGWPQQPLRQGWPQQGVPQPYGATRWQGRGRQRPPPIYGPGYVPQPVYQPLAQPIQRPTQRPIRAVEATAHNLPVHQVPQASPNFPAAPIYSGSAVETARASGGYPSPQLYGVVRGRSVSQSPQPSTSRRRSSGQRSSVSSISSLSSVFSETTVSFDEFYGKIPGTFDEKDKESLYTRGSQPYFMFQLLGKGAYAKVYKMIPASQGFSPFPDTYAVKVYEIKLNSFYYEKQKKVVRKENGIVSALMQSPHPNIVHFFERFQSRDLLKNYIVMESSHIGDLWDIFQSRSSGRRVWIQCREQYARQFIRGMAKGVRHLFSLGIAHGDVKLENILMFHPNAYHGIDINDTICREYWKMTPKLIDFNNSKKVESMTQINDEILYNQARCTHYCAAPESWFSNVPYDMKKADVYSLGGCLLSLLLGCHPFAPPKTYYPDERSDEALRRQMSMKRDYELISQLVHPFDILLKDLLLKTLEPKVEKRITIDQFLSHQWFTQNLRSLDTHERDRIGFPPHETTQRLPQDKWVTRRHSR